MFKLHPGTSGRAFFWGQIFCLKMPEISIGFSMSTCLVILAESRLLTVHDVSAVLTFTTASDTE